MRILYWIIALPVAVIITIFSVSNRDFVTLSLWPLPYEIDMPLFLPIILALVVGLVVGLAYEWLVNGKHRREARRSGNELRKLQAAVQEEKAKTQSPSEKISEGQKSDVPSAISSGSSSSAKQVVND